MKFRDRLIRFFYGRNGADNFSRFLSIVALAFLAISLFTNIVKLDGLSFLLELLAMVCIVLSFVRTFSKNITKRREENAKYLALKGRFLGWFRTRKVRFDQRKEYRFFKCPKCKATMRVPKGKGKLLIRCRVCGNEFSAKS